MERKIKQWNGVPELGSICRMTRSEIAAMLKKSVKTDLAKGQINAIVKQGFASDGKDCIRADDPKFAQYGALSFSDLGVLARYQENLLYSCEKWKDQAQIRKAPDGEEAPEVHGN